MTQQLQFEVSTARGRAAELDRRIERVLRTGAREGLEEWQLELLRILAARKGREHAISIRQIQALLQPPTSDLQPRIIKAAVKELVERCGIPIGSSRARPHGYFLIVDAEDHALATHAFKEQIKSEARRVRALSGPQFLAELFGQIRSELDAERSGGAGAPPDSEAA